MEPFTYKFSIKHVPFMHEQIWEAKQNLSVYSDLSLFEFTQFEEHIGSPKTVLEVGCGLGRGSIFLNHLLRDDKVSFILADRTGYTANTGAFDPEVDEFYNDLELTADFCQQNGIKKFRTFDTEVDDWATLPKADLIFSLCSFGMHVRIERYIDRLIASAKPKSTMIFGTRGAGYGPASFDNQFQEVLYIPGRDSRGVFPHENWLVLKSPHAAP
jgi:SAM-dependent methyltransferase